MFYSCTDFVFLIKGLHCTVYNLTIAIQFVLALSIRVTDTRKIKGLIFYKLFHFVNVFIIPPASKVLGGGVYKNHPVRPSVRPSMYLVSATLPKPLIGFL